MAATPETVPAADARRILMDRLGLAADPSRHASPAAVFRAIERMGYVQIDTINIVERAHHHILRTRFDGYRPAMLAKLVEKDRKLFEQWTHDLCAIPTRWFPYWRRRFAARADRPKPWEIEKHRPYYGSDPEGLAEHVMARVRREGPIASRAFEPTPAAPSIWAGKPARHVLEHLFYRGDILVSRRVGIERVYDVPERVLPGAFDAAVPAADAVTDWACREALDRLVVATPKHVRHFLCATDLPAVKRWIGGALSAGEVVEVLIESLNGSRPAKAVALPDWRRRAARAATPPDRIRLLSPFDPVLRDRDRLERLFGFTYRFEAFTPARKRQYGYYVLPILEGDRLVGRLDPKLHRDRGHLEVLGLWWEEGVKPTAARRKKLSAALDLLASQLGAQSWSLPGSRGLRSS